jgi:hypothetical protein
MNRETFVTSAMAATPPTSAAKNSTTVIQGFDLSRGNEGLNVIACCRLLHGLNGRCSALHLRPMKCAQLVPIRISHVGQVHRAEIALAKAWCILDRRAAVRHRRVVELANLFR